MMTYRWGDRAPGRCADPQHVLPPDRGPGPRTASSNRSAEAALDLLRLDCSSSTSSRSSAQGRLRGGRAPRRGRPAARSAAIERTRDTASLETPWWWTHGLPPVGNGDHRVSGDPDAQVLGGRRQSRGGGRYAPGQASDRGLGRRARRRARPEVDKSWSPAFGAETIRVRAALSTGRPGSQGFVKGLGEPGGVVHLEQDVRSHRLAPRRPACAEIFVPARTLRRRAQVRLRR